jgi:hypothetical protein
VCVRVGVGWQACTPPRHSLSFMYVDVLTPYLCMLPTRTHACTPNTCAPPPVPPTPPLNPVLVWRASGRPWSLWRAEPPLQAAPQPLPSTPSARAPWASPSRTLPPRIPTRRLEEVNVLALVHRGTQRESLMRSCSCLKAIGPSANACSFGGVQQRMARHGTRQESGFCLPYFGYIFALCSVLTVIVVTRDVLFMFVEPSGRLRSCVASLPHPDPDAPKFPFIHHELASRVDHRHVAAIPRACGPRWWLPKCHGGWILWRGLVFSGRVGLTHVMRGCCGPPALHAPCTSYCLLSCVLSLSTARRCAHGRCGW